MNDLVVIVGILGAVLMMLVIRVTLDLLEANSVQFLGHALILHSLA